VREGRSGKDYACLQGKIWDVEGWKCPTNVDWGTSMRGGHCGDLR